MKAVGSDPHGEFARALASAVAKDEARLRVDGEHAEKILTENDQGAVVSLDLVPFRSTPAKPTAAPVFSGVGTLNQLLDAYREGLASLRFEMDLPEARQRVHPFATEFMQGLFEQARHTIDDGDAARIAKWIEHFDIYVATKVVESLLNSKADLALLELADERGWHVHFDHLAVRCGSSETGDAERIAELLRSEHGYVYSQVEDEVYYRFADGWSAYLLYKMLDNGQVLRLFIDQSDAGHAAQIIQHWNHVYGYTAHHLAIRVTRLEEGVRVAVTLAEMMQALSERGIGIMEPTGSYTAGLLLQAFTRPERTTRIPQAIKHRLAAYGPGLETKIENGKLLELVSRKEMPPEFARGFYRLYGLDYQFDNPLHSAPIYPYFLPEQAAHVIRTSLLTSS